MDAATALEIIYAGGGFITAWIVIDRVFDYMFNGRNKKQ